jgi:hypothetical protein
MSWDVALMKEVQTRNDCLWEVLYWQLRREVFFSNSLLLALCFKPLKGEFRWIASLPWPWAVCPGHRVRTPRTRWIQCGWHCFQVEKNSSNPTPRDIATKRWARGWGEELYQSKACLLFVQFANCALLYLGCDAESKILVTRYLRNFGGWLSCR